MPLALEGIKVIEMGIFGPGTITAQWLGDLGAQVIMVEAPAGPQSAGWREGGAARAENARNKHSIVLNLKSADAQAVLHKLVKASDVFIEANRPGVSKRLGFDYEKLSSLNPRLIYCSVTGYGQNGPYKMMPGHGNAWEGTGGWHGMQGQGLGNMGGEYTGKPWLNPFNLADIKGALNAMVAITTALYVRDRIGTGQYIDQALVDGVIAVRSKGAPTSGVSAIERDPRPSWNVYECKDGKYIATAAGEEFQWGNLCKGLGVPELAKEMNPQGQRANEITKTFERIFKTRTRDEWFVQLNKLDTEAAKCNTIDEAAEDPQVKLRGMHVEVLGEDGHREIQYGTPFKLLKTPARKTHRRAPHHGEHTDQILAEAGYTKADSDKLRRAGAVS
ncbi:MAG: CaiB/BaiF CoA-transferase family protein [Dehalococcoidia bacterium]|nr:CaiB/BaiF CoA-transferase family protein [Dehalococcoidia bacterium]